MNRKIVKTALGRAIGDALVEYPLPVLPTEIAQRVAFADTATRGRSVMEAVPDEPAAAEITGLRHHGAFR